MPKNGVPGLFTHFFMSGLSWLGVLVTSSLPAPLTINQAHPLPNWVAPALAKAVANASIPPRSRSINSANFLPAQLALLTKHFPIQVWLKWPPPLLRGQRFQVSPGPTGHSSFRP